MNPIRAYQQTQTKLDIPTRIDLLLALFDGACDRLARAKVALETGDQPEAIRWITRVQLIVMDLAAGVRTEAADELGTNVLRLYEFVTNQLTHINIEAINSATSILSTLRDGFRGIREEAVNLEKTGQISSTPDATVLAAAV
jgi:flagellar secretion chaperone FliS